MREAEAVCRRLRDLEDRETVHEGADGLGLQEVVMVWLRLQVRLKVAVGCREGLVVGLALPVHDEVGVGGVAVGVAVHDSEKETAGEAVGLALRLQLPVCVGAAVQVSLALAVLEGVAVAERLGAVGV